MIVLLTTWMGLRGKANFRNLSRYSEVSEKTYSRWLRRQFDFVIMLGLDFSPIKSNPDYETLQNYGAMAA
jgi:hypothetical protein